MNCSLKESIDPKVTEHTYIIKKTMYVVALYTVAKPGTFNAPWARMLGSKIGGSK